MYGPTTSPYPNDQFAGAVPVPHYMAPSLNPRPQGPVDGNGSGHRRDYPPTAQVEMDSYLQSLTVSIESRLGFFWRNTILLSTWFTNSKYPVLCVTRPN